jgi:hypothetical protein
MRRFTHAVCRQPLVRELADLLALVVWARRYRSQIRRARLRTATSARQGPGQYRRVPLPG